MASVPIPAPAISEDGEPTQHGFLAYRIARGLALQLRTSVRDRDEPAAVSFIAVPLGMIAVALLGAWWTWIPLLSLAGLSVRTWRWSALLAAEEGFIGSEWAYVGTSWLRQYPDDRVLIGLLWIGFPVGLAAAGLANRRRTRGVERSTSR